MPKGVYTRTIKITPFKGKKHSESTKDKISKSVKEAIKNLPKRNFSKKKREDVSRRLKGNKIWLGRKHSEESKEKMRGKHKGEKSCLWKGGISLGGYTDEFNCLLKKKIRERDNYTCQICNKKQSNGNHSVHHIDYNKKNCNVKNLITLCKSCHTKTNNRREYWINKLVVSEDSIKNHSTVAIS